MNSPDAVLEQAITLAIVLGLLVFGLCILFFLRPRGGPEVAFARLLADPRRRTIFLGALCASLAALFAIGMSDTIESFLDTPAWEAGAVQTGLFGAGSVGIFVLMLDALNTRPMTLEEEWNLRETAARVSSGPPSISPPIDFDSSSYRNEREVGRPGR